MGLEGRNTGNRRRRPAAPGVAVAYDGDMTEPVATPIEAISAQVATVKAAFRDGVLRTIEARRTQLKQLKRFITEEEPALLAALAEDLGKPMVEAYGAELSFVANDVDYALRHLDGWIADTRTKVPLTFKPGSARVVQEALGTVLIIAPWNYPVQLLLAPVIPAIAAGNTVVLKPSEVAAATSNLLATRLPRYLDERVVTVITGGVAETTALLTERFDHILYTGNGAVARRVMEAAAKHLTPVTLELGGKSPAIIAADADVEVAAKRIAWGKFINAGQTCVAPDYVLVDASVERQFLAAMVKTVGDFYGPDPSQSKDYARIVNERHHDRLSGLLDGGGYEETVTGGQGNRSARYFPPTVLSGVKPDAAVMQDEIFGPILPVLTVGDLDEAIAFVNDRPKPLALYVFTNDDAVSERVIDRTSSGGVCVNHTVLHLAVPDLPFGGVGDSGTGAYHGRAGFDTFSHAKPVLDKPARPDPPIMYPPYKNWKTQLVKRFL